MTLIADLEETRAQTLERFALPPAQLDRTYGPGKWSVRIILNHLSDSEVVFHYRLKRVLSEPKQVIWATAQDDWARALDYTTAPLELAQVVYTANRDAVLHLARTYYDRSREIPFVHSEMGLRSLADEFEKVAWHNKKHLEQIERALT
ncbi:MAG TPA: DinB family protein [Gemmatimonadaceae bacterium]|nr:DinB family protein [Gemmatimonadaceae bacterium]